MTLSALVVVSLFGCSIIADTKQKIDDVKDAVGGLVNPVVTQGIVLGVEEPSDGLVADLVAGTEFGEGTAVTVFLADAANAGEISQAPIEGASVVVVGSDVVDARDDGNGVYTVRPGKLDYIDEDVWTVEVAVGKQKKPSEISAFLPLAPDLDVPELHERDKRLRLDFSGLDYDSALVVVLDSTGGITWTNRPSDATDMLGITQAEEELTEVVVPGEAFPTKDVYAVGVAGMLHSDGETIVDMNTVLSSVMAGKMRFYPVSTIEL